jgi:hypothetical protein
MEDKGDKLVAEKKEKRASAFAARVDGIRCRRQRRRAPLLEHW